MSFKIERIFLVLRSIRLREELVFASDGRKVRVRIANDQTALTIKGARMGPGHDEFEYPIPLEDAERLLAHHCNGRLLIKTRHNVSEKDCLFEVDVYEGLFEGIVIAEIELSAINQSFPRPAWLGDEVIGKEEYR